MSAARILVVEDEVIVGLDLLHRLTRLGYQVVDTITDGGKAVAAVIDTQPDLVLMDIRLAGTIDGIEAAQKIREMRDIPIVFLTAHSDPQTLARARVTLPFGYILKPFEERELHTQLEVALYRHRAERQIRESEEQLRAILNTAHDGILALDSTGSILSTNPAGEEIFGYEAGELIGLNVRELMPSVSAVMKNDDRGLVKTGGGMLLGAVRELSGKRKDGTLLPLEITLSRKNDPKEGNFIGIVRNITRRKQLENQLRQLVSNLREADRRKDEFLATLSHELRNPLAPIRNISAILRSIDSADPKFQWCCDVLDRQTLIMTQLMEELLDVSRIARGSLLLRKEWTDLREIVRSVIEGCGVTLEAAGQKLVVDIADGDVKLFVDSARVSQILSNLVNNAAKYTDNNGEVVIAAKCAGDEIVIQVKDSGIGISADLLPHVFEMFRQADSTLERGRGGLGVGLALVKSLVELHGGRVEAYSPGLGQGSVFTVRLPLTPGESDSVLKCAPTATQDCQPMPSWSKRTLIVDDNKMQAHSLGMLLQLWGHEVRLAHDGPGALAALGEYCADVALIDIGLPGMDGYEIARQIRERPQWRRMTLIAQTGWGSDSDREKSGQAGFDHHLTKPLDHQILEKILNEAAQYVGTSGSIR